MFDHNTLCVMIGDVSGKGIPAALFMAVTRTLLRMLWRKDPSPAAVLRRVNEEVARDNPRNMFVSLFCAAIDLRSAEVRYASGGHNPPFVIRAGGEVTLVPHVKGVVVGVMEGAAFEEGRLHLGAGDALLLYTDGVTEAMNPQEELFGTERAAATLATLSQGSGGESVEAVIRGLRAALADFAQEAEQSDDIAMLGFRYRQPCY
jgi:sigma-B regulation protein RsbU (phosphoserine phosphatase)